MKDKVVLEIEDLTVAYDDKPVLWDIDLKIQEGSLVAIVGPNGAGKSTLIKAAIGLIKPVTGTVKFFDKKYREVRKRVAYVPQRTSVDWHFPTTVFDVVLMGRYGHLGWFKSVKKVDREKALDALDMVGMVHLKNRQISELSGGQQQRVFLARALVQEADVYLMDEPFQGVDIKTEQAIVALFKKLQALGKTLIVVHHDLESVPSYFDHVLLINMKMIAYGHVLEVFTEENIFKTYKTGNSLLKEADDI